MHHPPRKRVQAIAQGRGREQRLIVPFAFEVAAQISARPLDEFRTDPTQLANGLTELHRAIGADGIVCAGADRMELESAGNAGLDMERIITRGGTCASLEACRRLRAVLGDEAALVAALTGPATLEKQFDVSTARAAQAFCALVRHFCDAGIDCIIAVDHELPSDEQAWAGGLSTAGNIARFHRALAYLWDGAGPLPNPCRTPLRAPLSAGTGLITTDGRIAADCEIETIQRWVRGSTLPA